MKSLILFCSLFGLGNLQGSDYKAPALIISRQKKSLCCDFSAVTCRKAQRCCFYTNCCCRAGMLACGITCAISQNLNRSVYNFSQIALVTSGVAGFVAKSCEIGCAKKVLEQEKIEQEKMK